MDISDPDWTSAPSEAGVVGLGYHTAALTEEARIRVDISAQPLSSALDTLRAQSNIQLLYSADLASNRSVPALKGEFSTREALGRLLKGTGLDVHDSGHGGLAIVRREGAESSKAMPEVVIISDRERIAASSLEGEAPAARRRGVSDTAKLLDDLLGVTVAGAGGVSALPSIQGMADQRVLTLVDGMQLSAAGTAWPGPGTSWRC